MKPFSRKARLLGAAALVLLCFAATWGAPSWALRGDATVCIFKTVTGRPCVFCGLTRALALGLHGDFAAAARMHPLWGLAAAVMLAVAAAAVSDALGGTRLLAGTWERLRPVRWVFAAVVALLGVVRLWPGLF